VLITALAIASCVGAAAAAPQDKKKRPARTYEEFQVAAGTHLAIELRSRLSSNTNQQADPVDGRLLRAVTIDNVELIPAGAPVLGTVSEVEFAGKRKPGFLAFTFHVIEHPETGSRAMIRATVLAYESERPKKGNVFPEVIVEKGREVSVSLLAPLTVRIPIKPPAQTPRAF
jgi:hypothetical protein